MTCDRNPPDPPVGIPERELIAWENEDVRASLLRGLADAAAGRIRPVPEPHP